jgi:tRNA(fMet)-specific endonuclease VapC
VIILDTDIATLHFYGHPGIAERIERTGDEVATTIVSRIEILRGRFDSVLKAADANQLLIAQGRLADAERWLAGLPIVSFDDAAAGQFERLRQDSKLKKIGRADLLIASIALAHRATLVTRNRRHFRPVPALALDDWASA